MYVLKHILYIYINNHKYIYIYTPYIHIYIYMYIYIDITHYEKESTNLVFSCCSWPSSKPSVALRTQLASFHAFMLPQCKICQTGRIRFSKKKSCTCLLWFPNGHFFVPIYVLDYKNRGPARKNFPQGTSCSCWLGNASVPKKIRFFGTPWCLIDIVTWMYTSMYLKVV